MAVEKKDVESGVREPLLERKDEGSFDKSRGRSMKMVVISTMVAVCGAFEFGACVSTLYSFLPLILFFGC